MYERSGHDMNSGFDEIMNRTVQSPGIHNQNSNYGGSSDLHLKKKYSIARK
jgi:hypothetical protein